VRRLGAALSWPLRRIGAAGPLLGRGIQSVGKGVGGLGRRGRALAQGVAARRNQQGSSTGSGVGSDISSGSSGIDNDCNGNSSPETRLDTRGRSVSIQGNGSSSGSSGSATLKLEATATAPDDTAAPMGDISPESTSKATAKVDDRSES